MVRSRKRSRDEYEGSAASRPATFGIGATLSLLSGGRGNGHEPAEHGEHARNGNAAEKNGENGQDGPADADAAEPGDWQTVTYKHKKRPGRRDRRDGGREAAAEAAAAEAAEAAETPPKKQSYPAISHAPAARLSAFVKIQDLQALVLYLLADGVAPQWVAVQHRAQVRKVVVVLLGGLEPGMLDGTVALGPAGAAAQPDGGTANGDLAGSTAGNGTVPGPPAWSPDNYHPRSLRTALPALPPQLEDLASVFSHAWPVKAAGDSRTCRVYSAVAGMLNSALPKGKGGGGGGGGQGSGKKGQAGQAKPGAGAGSGAGPNPHWTDRPVPVTALLASAAQLREHGIAVHSSLLQTGAGGALADGWVESDVEPAAEPAAAPQTPDTPATLSDPTAGRTVLAIDCEMCQTGPGRLELTRISVVDWAGAVLLDELVKPDNPITDYLTAYSGITPEKLAKVTTTLDDVRHRLLALLRPAAILAGHSLSSDLDALRLVHPYIVDTTMLYPHPGGDHLRSSLKWLAQKYLGRAIQGAGALGHDSVEDARAALDLVKQKSARGLDWGTYLDSTESLLRRVGRARRPGAAGAAGAGEARTTALVDWGAPRRGHGAAATVVGACGSDDEVVRAVGRVVSGAEAAADGVDADDSLQLDGTLPPGGVDLVWARLRELEAARGGTQDAGPRDGPAVGAAAAAVAARVAQIYASLPPRTALVVYTGLGDAAAVRELARLQALRAQFKAEYNAVGPAGKKWDELSVQWADGEEQALRRAFERARRGLGFVTVK